MIVTRHAAQRFVDRIEPSYSVDEALRILIDLSGRASLLQERTKMGQEQWVVDDIVFICKRDPRVTGDGLVAVTVARFERMSVEVREQLEHEIENLEKALATKELKIANLDTLIEEMRRQGCTDQHDRYVKTRDAKVRSCTYIRDQLDQATRNLIGNT